MYHGLVLRVHKVLVDGVLIGEGALHLTQVVVNLLAAILIHRAADGPDHAELEPQLYHPHVVVSVIVVNLQGTHTCKISNATKFCYLFMCLGNWLFIYLFISCQI